MTNASYAFMWTDRALFIGATTESGATTAVHTHPVVEVCVPLARSIDMRFAGRGRGGESLLFTHCPGAMVEANAKHQLTTRGARTVVLYLDPGTPDALAVHRHLAGRPVIALTTEQATPARRMLTELLDDPGLEQARAVCERVLDALVGEAPRAQARKDHEERRRDPRVHRVIDLLRSNLERVMSIDELASVVGLSEGRLRHLFRQEIGVPLRRYALWLRLRRALTVALSGGPMTDAAHAAGFSDAAHFTRTCRQMFGLAPSAFAPVDRFVAEPDQPDLVSPDDDGTLDLADTDRG